MSTLNILLVEDNEGDIVLIQEAFEEFNLSVNLDIVRDGEEAVNYLLNRGNQVEAKKPDLIILDINLPKINGHEVASIIKQNDSTKQIPVVIFTTSSSDSDISRAYYNLVNSYVIKPVDVNIFLKKIAEIGHYWSNVARLPKNR